MAYNRHDKDTRRFIRPKHFNANPRPINLLIVNKARKALPADTKIRVTESGREIGNQGKVSEILPGSGAIPVQNVEVLAREQLAPVHTRLNGPKPSQNTNLFHVADQRHNVESFQLSVDGVETANEVLEEQLECLRKTQHRVASDNERRDFLSAVVH